MKYFEINDESGWFKLSHFRPYFKTRSHFLTILISLEGEGLCSREEGVS